jgi:ubiquitin C-terminal hydrolase
MSAKQDSSFSKELSPAEFTSLSISSHRLMQSPTRSKFSEYHLSSGNNNRESPAKSTFSSSRSDSLKRESLSVTGILKSGHPELLELAQNNGSILDTSSLAFPFLQNNTTGLTNLGNTCYMNSILQCLMAIKPFVAIFLSSKEGFPGALAKAYAQFVQQFSSKSSGCITPAPLKKVVQQRARQFIGNE